MKFRIVEEKYGNQNPQYYIEEKHWYGWGKLCCSRYDLLIYYNSIQEAQNYLDKWYPERTKIIKEITII